MTDIDAPMEWPSFDHIPLEEALPTSRPKGQALSRFIWWDGEIREAEKQSIHYYANALHYGTAVFEGIRVYPTSEGPALFRVHDHMQPIQRELPTDGRADGAAAAGDERPPHRLLVQAMTARPVSSVSPASLPRCRS